MATINIEFDTNTKKIAVTKDDKKISDVAEIHCYAYGDEAAVEIVSYKHNEDEKYTEINRVLASGKEEYEKINNNLGNVL